MSELLINGIVPVVDTNTPVLEVTIRNDGLVISHSEDWVPDVKFINTPHGKLIDADKVLNRCKELVNKGLDRNEALSIAFGESYNETSLIGD